MTLDDVVFVSAVTIRQLLEVILTKEDEGMTQGKG
jgi:hypothetical protein